MASSDDRLKRERRSVEAEIRDAFASVTREGGVSWNESIVIDGDASGRTRGEARALDTEMRWEDLVDDANWNHEVGIGGFNFLDPVGFRYYLAPAMIRCIRDRGGELIAYALLVDGAFKQKKVSLFDDRQLCAVARFIRLMIVSHAAEQDVLFGEPWSKAYRAYWRQWDPGSSL